ncbi:WD domain, g-beta repeat domain-containing protein [Trichoderma breve]|uniref:WD domain, g-beta repeat domain-containing protein n=1 Tax=Trichoderma breve TaxID=2034170 RepID=A0A9W9JPZ1_9HYPO|nr:WD domain, g-beta repeat domain-containing protein [Trichoderma breve]KAJ4863639.1 WD domain, g-beta repeat domain-containing protein [Trichoderma breve]
MSNSEKLASYKSTYIMDPPPYEDPLGKRTHSLNNPLPEVPYSLEDPLREVSLLVNNLYVLSDAFCRHLRCQRSSSEDERRIIRDCLTAFSTLENKLVASVPGYYLENPLHDSLRDLVGYIVSFCDFERLQEAWEAWAYEKAKLLRDALDDDLSDEVHYLRDATTKPDLWESSCLRKLALGDSFEEKSRLLLVTGEAGCGKTNLLLHIAKLLLKRRSYAHSDPHKVVTHFSEDKNTIQDCLSSLREQLEGNNDAGFQLSPDPKGNISFDDVGKTLGKFSDDNKNTTIYIILDGFDKYSGYLSYLLKLISTTINLSPKIHWIVSIRSFRNCTAIKDISYTLADVSDNEKLKDAAKKFVSMQVDTFFKKTGIPEPSREDLEKTLMKRSKGNLLWITLACSIIKKDPIYAMHIAGNVEEKIEALYVRFNNLLQVQLLLTAEENKHLGEIVTILAAACRPLAISELRLLVQLSDAVDLEILIKRRFLFLLEVQDDIVRFSHELAKKYLMEKHVGQIKPEIHGKIALRCLDFFASSSSSGNLSDELPIHYAVSHWIKHFLISQSKSGDLYARRTGLGALTDVLSLGFTQWLDIIKQIRYPVSGVSRDLLQLRNFLTGCESKQVEQDIPHDCIIADVMDAVRFLRFSYDMGNVSLKDSLLFYPYEDFRLKLLKKNFPRLLNKPATEYKMKDIALNLHPQSQVLTCAYSPDGRFLASYSKSDKTISVWDIHNGTKTDQLQTRAPDGFNRFYIAFSVSGALAALTSLNTIDVWDFPTRKHIKTIRKNLDRQYYRFGDLQGLTFSPDGKQLATTNGKSFLTWALPSFEEHKYRINTPDTISCVKFLGDGLIAFPSSNIITLWREETAENVHILRGHKEHITSLEFLPKHQWLASASQNESFIRLWDPNSGLELYTLNSHNPGIRSISFSFDETKLASGYKDAIEIWDFENMGPDPQGLNMRRIEHFEDSKHVESVVFSPKDLSLASVLTGGLIRIWDTCAFRHEVKGSVTQIDRHTCAIQCLRFSHNGEFFATADRDGKICIWDGKTGDYRISIESKGCELHLISPDDQSLVTSSADGVMAIWNTGNWLLRRKLIGHRDKVLCVEFSPDGRHMASASHDGTIGIWDLLNEYDIAETKPAHQIQAEFECSNGFDRKGVIRACMAFSPDGTQLACSVRGGAAVQIWNVKPDGSLDASQHSQQLHSAKDAFNNCLSLSERIFFSQDANFIIASGDRHLSIWSIESKKFLILIRYVPMIFQSLRWDARKPEYIFTELGRFFIGYVFETKVATSKSIRYEDGYWTDKVNTSSGPQSESCTLNGWELEISWKGKPLVKFPSSYFPSHWHGIRMLWIRGKRIAMGYKSGHVTLLNFEGDDTEI